MIGRKHTKCDQPYEGFQEFWAGISILIYQPNKGNTKFKNIYQQGPLGMYVF
jgi:hypothetical protein